MKILLSLLTLLGLGSIARRWFANPGGKKRGSQDEQVDELIAEALARKLTLSREALLRAFAEGPDPDLAERITRAVQGVEVTFERKEAKVYEVEVTVAFQDGRVRCSRETSWDWLPDSVRGEMLRTGNKRVRQSWRFPWDNSALEG